MMAHQTRSFVVRRPEQLWNAVSRRDLLRVAGLGGVVVLLPAVFTACDDNDNDTLTNPNYGNAADPIVLDLRTDTGIWNFLFVFEQVEAQFYNAAVASSAFSGMTAEQQEVIRDIRAVENIHREFVRVLLGSAGIGTVAPNQSAIDAAAASASSILRTAEMLEDTGVATQVGIAKYFQSATNLSIAGKVNSVEARHVAAIRDIREAAGIPATGLSGTRFAGDDIVVPTGAYAGLNAKIEYGTARTRLIDTGFLATNLSEPTAPATKTGTPDFAPPSPTP
jgi:hypothetical protein